MAYGISNSQKRGITKTYSRKALSRRDRAEPQIIHRMGFTGSLETDSIGLELEDVEDEVLLPPIVKIGSNSSMHQTPKSKRILRDIPSSPLSPASNPFSDDEGSSISVPSSPPGQRSSSGDNHTLCKPAFGNTNRKRKHDDNVEPLSEVTNNAVQRRKVPQLKKQKLVQMKLDLGGQTNKTCKDCGMEYTPSNSEDASLHKSFHSQNIGGVDLGRGFVETITNTFDAGTPIIISIDGTAPPHIRKRARKVLDVVQKDLGAIDIEDDYLWGITATTTTKRENTSKKPNPGKAKPDHQPNDPELSTNDKPKLFLYCINDRCIGLCLVERIKSAAKVIPRSKTTTTTTTAETPSPSKPITQTIPIASSSTTSSSIISTTPSSAPMLLGISRIWVSKSRRGRGIATRLLEHARVKYFYGIEIPREMIAFSQPTACGIGLAESWFRVAGLGGAVVKGDNKKKEKEEGGWHVYVEGA